MEQSVKDILADDFWIMPVTPEYIDKGVPYITSKNIKNGIIDFTKVNYISQDAYENISKNRPILVGDILISMIGTLGETAEVKESDGSFYGQNMFLVRLDESKINKRYFLNFFKSNCVKRALEGKQNQSTQRYLKANHIEDLIIPVPALDEQKLIAKQLDKLAGIIALRNEELKYLDDLIKARFVEMFENGEYDAVRLGDVCTKITDGTHKTPNYLDDGITFISAKNIVNGELDFSDVKHISEDEYMEIQKRCQTETYDILLSKSGSLGVPVIVKTEEKLGLFESLAVIKYDRTKLIPEFLCEQLKTERIQRQFKTGTKGVAIKHLHLGVIADIGVIVPDLEEQNQFADFVKQVDKSKVAVQKALDETQLLFDSLMQEYFG